MASGSVPATHAAAAKSCKPVHGQIIFHYPTAASHLAERQSGPAAPSSIAAWAIAGCIQPQFGQLGPSQDSHHGPDAAAVYNHQPSQYSASQSQPQFGQLGPSQDSHHGPDTATVYHHQPSQYSASQSQPQFGQLGPSQDSHHGSDTATVYHHQPSQYSASQRQPHLGLAHPRPSVAHNFIATWAFPPSPTLTQKAHAAVILAASLNLAPQLTEGAKRVTAAAGPSSTHAIIWSSTKGIVPFGLK
ncbi:uncharacterized protein F5147DRAFT_778738 [Suillus discolor]|uniref:Uncharacterized protein n=1 Tax=Suillus discolor TaxID=1912936 RepID=A0A9P7EWJ0_9AGAM|nr:uncharacterized protein F5147DRAFT_778738 [Suillus discolor]KAG2095289.1 hypothetical protein F5147DRAFT_778738 [Suillus discolor]